MSQTDAGPDVGPMMPGPEDTTELRRRWGWILVLGVVLLLLGFGAIGHVVLAGEALALVFGAILLAGGVTQMMYAVWVRRWSGFFLLLLDGLLSVVLGGLVLAYPTLGGLVLALVMGIYFLVGGALRVVTALAWAMPHRGWQVFSGLVAVALGVLVLVNWPGNVWAFLGLYVGVSLLFNGWSLIMLALVARRMLPKTI
jgi:uncharacterized membrane protein HdeD (DUF308 family)